ncbi:hypothetical protein QQS21_000072 [Conoideocrella luteorostrata]|uniref:Alpha and gamma adaptin binding protein p34 n=1 Tax=Conoideocrella luteorostrata TaxID=1105319 RepID=A0AAJ0CZS8_9HYPO|nr:hypothetical protein QQS21_000072 [Conoideocrella luteorostrata]
MQVNNPRRILAVSLDGQAGHLSKVIQDLTGSSPQPASTSLAGTTHNLSLKTQYYTATVPIWLDLIVSPSEWAASFLSDEAGEVLAVLGGLVIVFALPESSPASGSAKPTVTIEQVRDMIHHVGEVVNKGLGGWEWDGVRLAIGVGESDAEEWDELCAEAGLEFVQVGEKQPALNEFGEKTGIARVKEAIESNDWAEADGDDLSDFGEFKKADHPDNLDAEDLDDAEDINFGYDPADFEGLKKAIWEVSRSNVEAAEAGGRPSGSDEPLESTGTTTQTKPPSGPAGDFDGEVEDDDQVMQVEEMMRKLQAVREAGEGLPDAQRRRMAARAVQEVMKEL